MLQLSLKDFKLDHLSVSQLRTFYMCGYRWWYDVVSPDKWMTAGWDPMLRGTAVDKATEQHMLKKAEGSTGLRLGEFKELAVHTHELGEDSHMFELPEAQSRDRVAKQAEEYWTTFGQAFQPWARESVQEKFKYTADDLTVPIHGVIDLTTTTGVVVDNKVSKKVRSQRDVDRDFQLTTYAMNQGATQVGIALITDENRPKSHFVISKRAPVDFDLLKHRYNQVAHAIEVGDLHPAPEGSWYCCAKWCKYYTICPFGEGEGPVPGLED